MRVVGRVWTIFKVEHWNKGSFPYFRCESRGTLGIQWHKRIRADMTRRTPSFLSGEPLVDLPSCRVINGPWCISVHCLESVTQMNGCHFSASHFINSYLSDGFLQDPYWARTESILSDHWKSNLFPAPHSGLFVWPSAAWAGLSTVVPWSWRTATAHSNGVQLPILVFFPPREEPFQSEIILLSVLRVSRVGFLWPVQSGQQTPLSFSGCLFWSILLVFSTSCLVWSCYCMYCASPNVNKGLKGFCTWAVCIFIKFIQPMLAHWSIFTLL